MKRNRILISVSTILSCAMFAVTFAACGTKKDPGKETGHQHSYNWSVLEEATCESEGTEVGTCLCGSETTRPIAALGHAWSAYTVRMEPTATVEGTIVKVCANDSEHVHKRAIPVTTDSNYETSQEEDTVTYTYQVIDSYTSATGETITFTKKNSKVAGAVAYGLANNRGATSGSARITGGTSASIEWKMGTDCAYYKESGIDDVEVYYTDHPADVGGLCVWMKGASAEGTNDPKYNKRDWLEGYGFNSQYMSSGTFNFGVGSFVDWLYSTATGNNSHDFNETYAKNESTGAETFGFTYKMFQQFSINYAYVYAVSVTFTLDGNKVIDSVSATIAQYAPADYVESGDSYEFTGSATYTENWTITQTSEEDTPWKTPSQYDRLIPKYIDNLGFRVNGTDYFDGDTLTINTDTAVTFALASTLSDVTEKIADFSYVARRSDGSAITIRDGSINMRDYAPSESGVWMDYVATSTTFSFAAYTDCDLIVTSARSHCTLHIVINKAAPGANGYGGLTAQSYNRASGKYEMIVTTPTVFTGEKFYFISACSVAWQDPVSTVSVNGSSTSECILESETVGGKTAFVFCAQQEGNYSVMLSSTKGSATASFSIKVVGIPSVEDLFDEEFNFTHGSGSTVYNAKYSNVSNNAADNTSSGTLTLSIISGGTTTLVYDYSFAAGVLTATKVTGAGDYTFFFDDAFNLALSYDDEFSGTSDSFSFAKTGGFVDSLEGTYLLTSSDYYKITNETRLVANKAGVYKVTLSTASESNKLMVWLNPTPASLEMDMDSWQFSPDYNIDKMGNSVQFMVAVGDVVLLTPWQNDGVIAVIEFARELKYSETLTINSMVNKEGGSVIPEGFTDGMTISASILAGGSDYITITATGDNTADIKGVTYESLNPDVAAVNGSGKVTGLKEGEATVKISTKDGALSYTVKINVTFDYATSMTLSDGTNDYELTEAGTYTVETAYTVQYSATTDAVYTFTATALPANSSVTSVIATSSDTDVVTVQVTGMSVKVYLANGGGTSLITVTSIDGSFIWKITVTVEYVYVTDISFDGMDDTIYIYDMEYTVYWKYLLDEKMQISPANASNKAYTVSANILTGSFMGEIDTNPENIYSYGCIGPYSITFDEQGYFKVAVTFSANGGRNVSKTVTLVWVNNVSLIDATEFTLSATEASINAGESVKINASSMGKYYKEAYQANYKVVTLSGGTFTYASSDENVAIVDDQGNVTGVGNGTATITVTMGEVSHTVTVNVTAIAIESAYLTDDEDDKTATSGTHRADEETLQLYVAVEGANGATPTWALAKANTFESSDPTVATVSSTGLVTFLKAGTVTITVNLIDYCEHAAGEEPHAIYTLVIENIAVTNATLTDGDGETSGSFTVTNSSNAVGSYGSITLTATARAENEGDTPSVSSTVYASSNEAVATVNTSGVVTFTGVGTANITVTFTDFGGTTASATYALTVTNTAVDNSGVSLTASDETSANVDVKSTLDVTAAYGSYTVKTITYASDHEEIATVDATGKVTGVDLGTATITATFTDYAGNTATATFSVTVVNVAITNASATNVSIVKTASSSTATITLTYTGVAKTVTYTSNNESVATVDATGKVTAVASGSTTVTITITDYAGNETQVTCNVTINEMIAMTAGNTYSKTVAPGATAYYSLATAKNNYCGVGISGSSALVVKRGTSATNISTAMTVNAIGATTFRAGATSAKTYYFSITNSGAEDVEISIAVSSVTSSSSFSSIDAISDTATNNKNFTSYRMLYVPKGYVAVVTNSGTTLNVGASANNTTVGSKVASTYGIASGMYFVSFNKGTLTFTMYQVMQSGDNTLVSASATAYGYFEVADGMTANVTTAGVTVKALGADGKSLVSVADVTALATGKYFITATATQDGSVYTATVNVVISEVPSDSEE